MLKDNSGAIVISGTDTVSISQSNLASAEYNLEYTGTNNGCISQNYTLLVAVN